MTVKIFLSTVSDEFRRYRDLLRSDLTRHNVEVKVQEDFRDLGSETLDKQSGLRTGCLADSGRPCGRAGRYRSAKSEPVKPLEGARGSEPNCPRLLPRKSGSHLTLRWREMDSNFRFRAR